MRLLDLEPRWMNHAGKNVAIVFLCPHCHVLGRRQWLSCFFVPAATLPVRGIMAIDDADDELFTKAFVEMGMAPADAKREAWQAVSCKPDIAWKRDGHDFATISITPSIDASGAGHWHGHITGGQIVGGL